MTPDSPPAPDKKEMPVAWVRDATQRRPARPGRVFTTTHGASEDLLNDGFRRMAVNAVLWAAGLEASIRADQRHQLRRARIKPTTFSFDGFVKGMKPADLAGWDSPIPPEVPGNESARMTAVRRDSAGRMSLDMTKTSDCVRRLAAGARRSRWLARRGPGQWPPAEQRSRCSRTITSHHRQHAGRADAVRRLARDDAAGAVPEARAGRPQPRLQRRRDRDAPALEELRHAGRVAERRWRSRSAATRTTGFAGTNTKADVVFAFFGYNESFAGQAGLEAFKEQLTDWITHTLAQKYNGKTAPRVVLFSPIAHEDLRQSRSAGRQGEQPAPGALHQGDGARSPARTDVTFVDLFTPSAQAVRRRARRR